ncbi:unnamed protein product [Rotaria sp. Silwood1]|nr:unnamed protein product [Rotaria sp. Silwood1]
MAEWGKGDPRWIVEDRPDATNPNNWHWKEKNATQWSKDKLNELLIGLKIENDDYICEIKELKRCSGEASANNRKAKLVFLYEWQIEGKWEGSMRKGENQTKYEGSFEIPNLSDENSIDEVNITFFAEKSKGEKLKEIMKKQGLILPTKNTITTNNTQSISSTNNSKTVIHTQLPINQNKLSTMTMRDIKLHDTFKCTKIELFQAFCDMNKVKAFTQNSVSQYDCRKGGFFSLFSDNITGRFLDIVPYDHIDMLWRFKSWPSDHYSHVSLLFSDGTDETKIVIQQTGVPSQFYDNTREGWKRFYLESIKSTFGYGSRLQ